MCQIILWSEQGLLHEQVLSYLISGKLCGILIQYEIELMYTFGIIAF